MSHVPSLPPPGMPAKQRLLLFLSHLRCRAHRRRAAGGLPTGVCGPTAVCWGCVGEAMRLPAAGSLRLPPHRLPPPHPLLLPALIPASLPRNSTPWTLAASAPLASATAPRTPPRWAPPTAGCSPTWPPSRRASCARPSPWVRRCTHVLGPAARAGVHELASADQSTSLPPPTACRQASILRLTRPARPRAAHRLLQPPNRALPAGAPVLHASLLLLLLWVERRACLARQAQAGMPPRAPSNLPCLSPQADGYDVTYHEFDGPHIVSAGQPVGRCLSRAKCCFLSKQQQTWRQQLTSPNAVPPLHARRCRPTLLRRRWAGLCAARTGPRTETGGAWRLPCAAACVQQQDSPAACSASPCIPPLLWPAWQPLSLHTEAG